MHIVEMREQLRDVLSAEDQRPAADTKRHHNQRNTENRIDLSDDLVDGDKGRDEVVDQDHCQPEGRIDQDAGLHAGIGEQRLQKACRADREDRAGHNQKDDTEDTHDVLHHRTEQSSGYLGDRRTVLTLGHHPGQIIVYAAGKDGSEGNPEEDNRSPHRTGDGAEDRSQTGNIQQLYQKQLPGRHDNIVHTIVDRNRRGLTVIRRECVVHKLAVREIPGDQDHQTKQKAKHNVFPPFCASA